ncbi:hypothetical protein L3X38_005797 [Prunus dulcis]|uniref:Uncharacterized protein n=1 Tax=Prunus dulcis TaxID=3755 RepID=A0AAD4ZRL1_PRUDU|nr:hypothetical protein L3X38_005797 [Prunus dulcis]
MTSSSSEPKSLFFMDKSKGSRSSTSHFECDYNHKINNNDNELIAKSLEDKQESVDLDPSELPCLYESDFDIEEEHQEINGERRVKEGTGHIRTYQEEGSWQVVVSKPAVSKKIEPQSFYDVLSFWKCKEKGQETYRRKNPTSHLLCKDCIAG